jgi:hypothetical protein
VILQDCMENLVNLEGIYLMSKFYFISKDDEIY